MFTVRIKLYGRLREFGREVELAIEEGSTVEDLLRSLTDFCGREFAGVMLQYSTGVDVPLGRSFFVLVNGVSIDSLREGSRLRLHPGDVVSLFPHISGG